MTFPGRGRGRVARGLVLSAACLLVPTAGHVMADGEMPSAGPVMLAAALLSVACVALADRRYGAGDVAMFLFASQPVLHILLALSGHGAVVITVDVGMVLGHAAAAALLTVLLAGGESVLWAMASLSSTVLLRRVRALLVPDVVPAIGLLLARSRPFVATTYVLTASHTAPRRGPPALSYT